MNVNISESFKTLILLLLSKEDIYELICMYDIDTDTQSDERKISIMLLEMMKIKISREEIKEILKSLELTLFNKNECIICYGLVGENDFIIMKCCHQRLCRTCVECIECCPFCNSLNFK
jgi:hypothetical protein